VKYSIIIPIHNEKPFYIKRVLKNIGKVFKSEHFEIILSSTENLRIKHNNLKIIISKQGRGIQLNKGIRHSSGNIMIFLHCDTLLHRNSLEIIKQNIDNDKILAFKFGTYPKKKLLKMIEFFTNLRAKITKTPYGDQCYILTTDTFKKIGEFPDEELEDLKFIKNAKRKKVKITILNEKIKTSPRNYYKYGFLKTVLKNRIKILKYLFAKI
jgi:glycosyltransferase involved in cell wall biosynthesis